MGDKWTLTAPREQRRNARYFKSNPTKHDSLSRLESPPKKLHDDTSFKDSKSSSSTKFFFSHFRRFSSTTSFEEKVRIVNNLSDSLTDDKRKYSRNLAFYFKLFLSSFVSFLTYFSKFSFWFLELNTICFRKIDNNR